MVFSINDLSNNPIGIVQKTGRHWCGERSPAERPSEHRQMGRRGYCACSAGTGVHRGFQKGMQTIFEHTKFKLARNDYNFVEVLHLCSLVELRNLKKVAYLVTFRNMLI